MRILLVAALIACALPLAAAVAVDLVAGDQDTAVHLAALRRLGLGEHVVPPEQRLAARVGVHLHQADLASVRQATAHALGGWWSDSTDGLTVYRQDFALPTGPLSTRSFTSALVRDAAWEGLARDLLAPWLAQPGTGVALDPGSGLWVATLSSDGQQRLIALLGLLERREVGGPSLIPHARALPPAHRSRVRLTVRTWAEAAEQLAAQFGISISRAADLPPPPTPIDLPPGSWQDQVAALERWRVRSAWIDGVWCWGSTPPVRRAHPAQQSRLALLPVVGISDATAGHLLAATLARRNGFDQALPGQEIRYVAALQALLISAEPALLHQVWDDLEAHERTGGSP